MQNIAAAPAHAVADCNGHQVRLILKHHVQDVGHVKCSCYASAHILYKTIYTYVMYIYTRMVRL